MTHLLEVTNVHKYFGGVRAVQGVSLTVQEGRVVGLIGPNGSGKSTLLNVVAGVAKPTAGSVMLDGRRIDNMPAHRVVELGIAKTHQIPKPFLGMTTRDNVGVAVLYGSRKDRDLGRAFDEANWVLRLVGLEPHAETLAANLTVQDRKRLELARVIATGSRILLLDEVFAGLSPDELREAMRACTLGPSGAGKSTILKVVNGLLRPTRGQVLFAGDDITNLPAYERPARGIASCPEGRRLFPQLTVETNLRLGAYAHRAREKADETLEYVYGLFPRLRERARVKTIRLSGGEQQMVGIGRALMAKPLLLVLDEPSLGLAPKTVSEIFEKVRGLREEGMTLLLVEQNAYEALKIADFGYVVQNGHVVRSGTPETLLDLEALRRDYFAIDSESSASDRMKNGNSVLR